MESYVAVVMLVLAGCAVLLCSAESEKGVVTNSWHVVFRRDTSVEEAQRVASAHGFHFRGQVLRSKRDYHFVHMGLPAAGPSRSVVHTKRLRREPLIASAYQQIGYSRQKRGYQAKAEALNHKAEVLGLGPVLPKESDLPKDPLFPYEWYLRNVGQRGGKPGLDLNVQKAWDMGITGKNVTTAIMDDGIDYMHPDLYNNFNAEASFDYSSNDPFPYPRYTDTWFNSHGTRCAGEIAAARDGKGAVGIAYDSKVAGIRMLDQPFMTDLIEASSMGHMPELIDIYSASWGPTDDGKTCDGPRELTREAIVKGVNEGRGGRGSIYVWASGDGGALDDCNCDGYASSMWTISINSATNDGQTAVYDESCASTLTSSFSNGKSLLQDAGVATVDLYGNTTLRHSGTSAAAPEAAGVFALALEANPELTWRDLQHLVVLTSKRNHLHDAAAKHTWQLNGAGIEFNHLFGFGVLDAGDIVDLAQKWVTVPERFHCSKAVSVNSSYTAEKPVIVRVNSTGCKGQENEVNFLEHVQVFVSTKATYRGAITIYITSPMGTRSMLMSKRPRDDSSTGFVNWPFMTTHTWGENPRGTWTLEVGLDPISSSGTEAGFLSDFTLVLHGTKVSTFLGQTDEAHKKLQLVKKIQSSSIFETVISKNV